MRSKAKYSGISRTLEGTLAITFEVEDDVAYKLEELEGELMLEVTKYRYKRSLNANAYLWKLCDLIAKKLGTDKDTVYFMVLSNYGVFTDIEVIDKAVDQIKALYRYTEELYRYKAYATEEIDMVCLRCYTGSSQYDTKQMSELINGVVNEANDLGIDTWTQEEIDYLVASWKGRI